MKSNLLLILIPFFSTTIYAQLPGYIIDERDGKKYPTVQIGDQVWLNENLKTSWFLNGDSILEVKNAIEWQEALKNKQPAFCYYEYDTANNEAYGKIYNWYAVIDQRGLAPRGWYIPSSKEVQIFENMVDYIPKNNLSFYERWYKLGFEAQFGGNCTSTGTFNNLDAHASWWTTDEDQTNSWSKFGLGWYSGHDYDSDIGKKYGFSVRCIKQVEDLFYVGPMNQSIYAQMTTEERMLYLDCFRYFNLELKNIVWASEKTKKKIKTDSTYYYNDVLDTYVGQKNDIESEMIKGKHHLKFHEFLFTLERKNGHSKIKLQEIF